MLELTPKTIEYLEEQVDHFENLVKKVSQRPTMEKVHKLRVATRRIRSILELTHEDIRPLKRLAKVLGKIRDMDVAIMNSAHYDLDPKKLKKRRKVFEIEVLELLQKKNKNKILEHLHTFTDKLESHPNLKAKLTTQQVERDLLDWTGAIKDEELHDVRIVLKKARYLFEAAGKPVEYLKKIQDQLGQVHDLEVLETFYKNNKTILKDRTRQAHAAKKEVTPTVKRALRELRKL